MNDKKLYLLLFFVSITWGAVHPLAKSILGEISPYQLAFLRALLGFVILSPILIQNIAKYAKKENFGFILKAGALGIIGYGIYQIMLLIALEKIPASANTLIGNISPIHVAILSLIFLKERISKYQMIGIFLGFLGVFVISNAQLGGELIGYGMTFVASILWGLFTFLGRGMKEHDPTETLAIGLLFASIFLLPFSNISHLDSNLSLKTAGIVLFLGIIATALNGIIWYHALGKMEASRVSVFVFLVPLWGVLFSHLYLGEAINSLLLLGALIIVSGIALAQKK